MQSNYVFTVTSAEDLVKHEFKLIGVARWNDYADVFTEKASNWKSSEFNFGEHIQFRTEAHTGLVNRFN